MFKKIGNYIVSLVSVLAMVLTLSPVAVRAVGADALEKVDFYASDESGSLITNEAPLFQAYSPVEIEGKEYFYFCTAAHSYEKAKELMGELVDQLYLPEEGTELGHITLDKVDAGTMVLGRSVNDSLMPFAMNDLRTLATNQASMGMMSIRHVIIDNTDPVQYTFLNADNFWLKDVSAGDSGNTPFFDGKRVFCVNHDLTPFYNPFGDVNIMMEYNRVWYSDGGSIDKNYSEETAQKLKQFYCIYKSVLDEKGLSESEPLNDDDLANILQMWVWRLAEDVAWEEIDTHFPGVDVSALMEHEVFKDIEAKMALMNLQPEVDADEMVFKGYGKENAIEVTEVSDVNENLAVKPLKGLHVETTGNTHSLWIDESFDGNEVVFENIALQEYAEQEDSSLLYSVEDSEASDSFQSFLRLGGQPVALSTSCNVMVDVQETGMGEASGKDEVKQNDPEKDSQKEIVLDQGNLQGKGEAKDTAKAKKIQTGVKVFNPVAEFIRFINRLI